MIRMLRLQLRRDRLQLPLWIVLTAMLWLVSGRAIRSEFGAPDKAASLLDAVIANPGVVAIRGLPDGVETDQLVYFQVFTFVAILAGLMATFLVTRHVRAEEERGRQELVGATPIARGASLRAALVLGVVAEAVLGAASAAAMIAADFDPRGSWLAGAAVAAVGISFLGIGALLGQLLPTGRSANSASVVVVLAAYLLRSIGDSLGEPDLARHTIAAAWPSFLTPIGWAEQLSPFREQRIGWLAAIVALGVVAAAAALAVQSRRDLGASLIGERPGRASAPRYLGTPVALAWRLHWGSALGWALGGAVFGLFAGGLSGAIRDAASGNEGIEQILQALGSGAASDLTDSFVTAVAAMAGVLGAAAAIQALLRLRGEESDGRAELLLSAPMSRPGWLLSSLVVAAVSAILVALAFGGTAAASFAATLPEEDRLGSSLLAGVAQLPAIAFFAGLVAAAVALLPRAATAIGWIALVAAYLLGPLGTLLGLDEAVTELSPFQQTPAIPGDDPDWSGALIVLALGAALTVLGLVAMRRRQLSP